MDMYVKMEEEDVLAGIPRKCDLCAGAIAITRVTNLVLGDSGETYQATIKGKRVVAWVPGLEGGDRGHTWVWDMPDVLYEFVNDFDDPCRHPDYPSGTYLFHSREREEIPSRNASGRYPDPLTARGPRPLHTGEGGRQHGLYR